jgi:thiamine biosynthesis lipoprotein
MISRARPLLGTIVSIRAEAHEDAVCAAFKAVERVHELMSAQSGHGDLARINDHAHRAPVPVHSWTFDVLRHAVSISKASGGAFDVTLGRNGTSWKDISLHADGRIGLRRRARLDLGGIAKGFAVDRAVEALRRAGASSGSVNAGGDLRLFGDAPQIVRVRMPASPQLCVPLGQATNLAFATSAGYFQNEALEPRTGRPSCTDSSISVSAPSCMVADALTKAVAAIGPLPELLARFRARAYLVDTHGKLHASAH